jgi:hypothetical protein
VLVVGVAVFGPALFRLTPFLFGAGAGADVVRSMAECAGATITVAEGSHGIMVSSHRSSRMLF